MDALLNDMPVTEEAFASLEPMAQWGLQHGQWRPPNRLEDQVAYVLESSMNCMAGRSEMPAIELFIETTQLVWSQLIHLYVQHIFKQFAVMGGKPIEKKHDLRELAKSVPQHLYGDVDDRLRDILQEGRHRAACLTQWVNDIENLYDRGFYNATRYSGLEQLSRKEVVGKCLLEDILLACFLTLIKQNTPQLVEMSHNHLSLVRRKEYEHGYRWICSNCEAVDTSSLDSKPRRIDECAHASPRRLDLYHDWEKKRVDVMAKDQVYFDQLRAGQQNRIEGDE